MNPTSKISSSHLGRLAMVYVRQSTVAQVRQNTESTNRQYGLAGTAAELGWLAEQIVVVDADLGVSGRFGSQRDGYREIVARMCMGEVGAVFGLEVSRFGRSNADLSRLMELARLTDTLLIDVDGVYDLANVNDRILLGLKGQMSEIELHFLLGRLHGAKLAAAHRGELRHPLPVGFVYDEDGLVVKDADEQVRLAVADVFAEFHRTGSALGVMRAFAETGRLFPQRAWGGAWAGKLKWGKLTHARVLQALKNPTYAGVYTFGKTRDVRQVQPDGSVRSSRRRRAREEWTVLIEDHHEGYLSWPQYLANEAKLAANNTQRRARPVREGSALCQGIIFCGVCGSRAGTRYDRGDRKVSYTCQIKDSARTVQCRTVAASTVDDAVTVLFLTPSRLNRSAWPWPPPTKLSSGTAERTGRPSWPCNAPATKPNAPNAPSATSNRKTVWWQEHWSPDGRPDSPRSPTPRRRWRPRRPPNRRCRPKTRWKPWLRICPGCGTPKPPAHATANGCCAPSSPTSPCCRSPTRTRSGSGCAGTPARPTN